MTNLSDCRCIRCGSGMVGATSETAPGRSEVGVIACDACDARFDVAWGVPFLLEFDELDFSGLLEIVANAQQISPFTTSVMEEWSALLVRYHAASDKPAFVADLPPEIAPWLPFRYNEWLQVEALVGAMDFRGLKVLDVGAGLGFDSFRHVRAGADVTALEFSPVLAREGARNLPMIRWIGGASHVLPFQDGSFDAVFSNAALHHMRDISVAIEEMLRVLKPGGLLVTTGDSYRKDSDGEDVELAIFESHTGVLSGINERVPRFGEYVDPLVKWRNALRPELYTQIVYGAWAVAGRSRVEGVRSWPFDSSVKALRDTSGSLALKVRTERSLGVTARLQKPRTPLSPARLTEWLADPPLAVACLSEWAPTELIDAPFPKQIAKADLLNGWRKGPSTDVGEAYLRGRWFMTRKEQQNWLGFGLRAPSHAAIEVLVNGRTHQRVNAGTDWCEVWVDVRALDVSRPFCVEIRRLDHPHKFEDGLFWVRQRSWRTTSGDRPDVV